MQKKIEQPSYFTFSKQNLTIYIIHQGSITNHKLHLKMHSRAKISLHKQQTKFKFKKFHYKSFFYAQESHINPERLTNHRITSQPFNSGTYATMKMHHTISEPIETMSVTLTATGPWERRPVLSQPINSIIIFRVFLELWTTVSRDGTLSNR